MALGDSEMHETRKRSVLLFAAGLMLLSGILAALTVPEHTSASRWRRTLGTLDPAQVREIHVGPRRIDDPAAALDRAGAPLPER